MIPSRVSYKPYFAEGLQATTITAASCDVEELHAKTLSGDIAVPGTFNARNVSSWNIVTDDMQCNSAFFADGDNRRLITWSGTKLSCWTTVDCPVGVPVRLVPYPEQTAEQKADPSKIYVKPVVRGDAVFGIATTDALAGDVIAVLLNGGLFWGDVSYRAADGFTAGYTTAVDNTVACWFDGWDKTNTTVIVGRYLGLKPSVDGNPARMLIYLEFGAWSVL